MTKRTMLVFILGAVIGCAVAFTVNHATTPVVHAQGLSIADPRFVVVQDGAGNLTVFRDDSVKVDPICSGNNTENCASFLFSGTSITGAANTLSDNLYSAKP